MKFALLISGEDEIINRVPTDGTPISPDFLAYTEAMRKAGVLVGGERLTSARKGARVRVREGKSVVLDGPYSDTREQLGGFFMIEVANADEALAWATRCPAAKVGTIEVREVLTTTQV